MPKTKGNVMHLFLWLYKCNVHNAMFLGKSETIMDKLTK